MTSGCRAGSIHSRKDKNTFYSFVCGTSVRPLHFLNDNKVYFRFNIKINSEVTSISFKECAEHRQGEEGFRGPKYSIHHNITFNITLSMCSSHFSLHIPANSSMRRGKCQTNTYLYKN